MNEPISGAAAEAALRYQEGPFGLDVADCVRRSAFVAGAEWAAAREQEGQA